MPSDGELMEAMGTWLGQLAPWDVFATWTFGGPPRKPGADIWGQRLSRKNGAPGRWHGVSPEGAMFWARRHMRWLEKRAEQPIYGFVGVERGQSGGLVHLHALLGNVGHLKAYCEMPLPAGQWGRSCCMAHSWPCGYARVFPYDHELGARYYVSKYVSKQLAEWELIGFPASPQISMQI